MNTDLKSIEEKLLRLKPAKPSHTLMARLKAAGPYTSEKNDSPAGITKEKHSWPRIIFKASSPLAAAALAMLAFKIYMPGCTSSQPVAQLSNETLNITPTETVDCIVGAREIGTYQASNGNSYKVVQCIGLKQDVWENTKDGTRIEQTTPRQKVLLVSMNTY